MLAMIKVDEVDRENIENFRIIQRNDLYFIDIFLRQFAFWDILADTSKYDNRFILGAD